MDLRHWFIRYSWVVNLLLLASISYVSAKTVNGYVSGKLSNGADSERAEYSPTPEAPPPPAAPTASIVERDLFAAAQEEDISVSDADTLSGDTAEMRETSLRLDLIATVFYGEGFEYNLATIKNKQDMKTDVYIAGDTIGSEATVTEVQLEQVILDRKGTKEILPLVRKESAGKGKDLEGIGPQATLDRLSNEERAKMLEERRKKSGDDKSGGALSGRIRQVGDNQYVIEKAAIDEALSDMNSIITQARAIPNFVGAGADRKVDGFRIYRIQPGSIYEYLGLQNGDIIKSINGEPMDSIEKALSVFQAIRNETKFNLTIQRQQNTTDMNYEVE